MAPSGLPKTTLCPGTKTEKLSNTGLDKLLACVGGWGPISEKVLWPYEGATLDEVKKIRIIAKNELPELMND